MSVRAEGDMVFLEGRCAAGDAEALLVALQERPEAGVDIAGVAKMHLAVLQVLLVLRPPLSGTPAAPLLAGDVLLRHNSSGLNSSGDINSNGDKAT
jgi:hypothetical protein